MAAEHRVDPIWLEVVATQLTRSSKAALQASHELLGHYSDTGDDPTQRAVDDLTNRASEALGALAGSLADTSCALQNAVAGHAAADRPANAPGPEHGQGV